MPLTELLPTVSQLTHQDKLRGKNWRHAWRDTMDYYESLIRDLRQQGRVENFTHRLRRPDGSLGEYIGDAEIVDFMGVPYRILWNREWRIVEASSLSM